MHRLELERLHVASRVHVRRRRQHRSSRDASNGASRVATSVAAARSIRNTSRPVASPQVPVRMTRTGIDLSFSTETRGLLERAGTALIAGLASSPSTALTRRIVRRPSWIHVVAKWPGACRDVRWVSNVGTHACGSGSKRSNDVPVQITVLKGNNSVRLRSTLSVMESDVVSFFPLNREELPHEQQHQCSHFPQRTFFASSS